MDLYCYFRCIIVIYINVCVVDFFFFKQKTAYEMRISDWSSDVCSSDLCATARSAFRPGCSMPRKASPSATKWSRSPRPRRRRAASTTAICATNQARSEEHTSELQSLMRISYAVFCLKKKKKITTHQQHHSNYKINLYTSSQYKLLS